ncbi:MAG: sigma 54-interacting transcriptional regulator [Pseudomonadota bacterium]
MDIPSPEPPVENLLERALDSLEAAVFIFDPSENRIVQFNQAALKATGRYGYELVALPVSELFPGQLPEVINLTLECQDLGRAWAGNMRLATEDQKGRAVEVFLSEFEFGGKPIIIAKCYDLRTVRSRRAQAEVDQVYRTGGSERERINAVFRQLERGNQLILHAAGEGIYGVDANGDTTFLNPAAEAMLGWPAEELIGRCAHTYFHHSHEDGTGYPIKACPIYQAFRDGQVHNVENEVFWRKDGTSFPVEYTSTPIEDKGRLLGAVVVFRDVSLKRRTQNELRSALCEVEALKRRLEQENEYLQYELRGNSNHKEIVGTSVAVRQILEQVELVGASNASVLITGESGTGKELIARAIHAASPRSHRPLIRVNCASIPRDLFESEFFGHAKGAFTGAVAERIGRFELAHGGTIFLDEVGELPLENQAKLLRILQEKQFERVGETKTRQVDVRVIAATNRNLKKDVAEKAFREDLYFRLNVFPVESPPLRDRLDDIPDLATLFLRRACQRANKLGLQISMADVERLKGYHWPGNIRELENVIERAVITAVDGRLRFHVPKTTVLGEELALSGPEKTPATHVDPLGVPATDATPPGQSEQITPPPPATQVDNGILTNSQLKARERDALETALRKTHGRVSGPNGAARLLGLKPTTLYSRLKRSGIDTRAFKQTDGAEG